LFPALGRASAMMNGVAAAQTPAGFGSSPAGWRPLARGGRLKPPAAVCEDPAAGEQFEVRYDAKGPDVH